MGVWMTVGYGNLGQPRWGNSGRVVLTAWVYPGPSQTAKILDMWPSQEAGSFLLSRTAGVLSAYGNTYGDFNTYPAGMCYLHDAYSYTHTSYDGAINDRWLFIVLTVTASYRSGGPIRTDGAGPDGSTSSVGMKVYNANGVLLDTSGDGYTTTSLVEDPLIHPPWGCGSIDLEKFDLWKVHVPTSNFEIGRGVGGDALFEGAVAEVALWRGADAAPFSGLMNPKPFMPLMDTTGLVAYWPLINSMKPMYFDPTYNDLADVTGQLAGDAYFGGHPFPVEEVPWYAEFGLPVEDIPPIKGKYSASLLTLERTATVEGDRTAEIVSPRRTAVRSD